MRNFLISVATYLPYKKEWSYGISAFNVATATCRAIKLFKKENGIKRKRVREISVKAITL